MAAEAYNKVRAADSVQANVRFAPIADVSGPATSGQSRSFQRDDARKEKADQDQA